MGGGLWRVSFLSASAVNATLGSRREPQVSCPVCGECWLKSVRGLIYGSMERVGKVLGGPLWLSS